MSENNLTPEDRAKYCRHWRGSKGDCEKCNSVIPEDPMQPLTDRLFDAQIASCSCNTKSPEMHWHAGTCHYRLFFESVEKIAELQSQLTQAQEALMQIKSLVVGERSPNWSLESPTDCTRTYNTRGRIANICDIALSQQRSGQ